MDDVLDSLRTWVAAGRSVALATIVGVERKAPRGPGAAMAVSVEGEILGSLSGGCVEGALAEAAGEVIASGNPTLLPFGIKDDQAFAIGLACGGTIHVFLEPIGPADLEVFDALVTARTAGEACALVTVIAPVSGSSARAGAKILHRESSAPLGSTGDASLDAVSLAEATALLRRDASERVTISGADVFIHSFAPPPVLHVIGAVHPAAELCRAARALGFRVVVCDPRSSFGTPERLPDAHEIVREWPDEYLRRARPTPRDAVVILTHDLKFDVPALQVALASDASYVGAMGSKKNQARRAERLREEGVSDEAIARIRAPIGLAIGAETPAEIAISVLAEIVAERRLGTRVSVEGAKRDA